MGNYHDTGRRLMEGRILKGVGGLYTLHTREGDFLCRARGKLRRDGSSPLVGDFATFTPPTEKEEGVITRLLPRKNCLKRPPLANAELLMVVVATENPLPDWLLVDRLLAQAVEFGMEAVLVLNKADLNPALPEEMAKVYKHIPVLGVSAAENRGMEALRQCIGEKTVVLAGPSGVGKSSLMNRLLPASAQVGAISEKMKRGRHTTRHAQLFPVGEGWVADTPGFSLLDMDLMIPAGLEDLYPDFEPYRGKCRFVGCAHHKEPDCAVKAAVEAGELDVRRYQGYVRLLEELRESWRNRYV